MSMTTEQAMKRLSIFVRADADCYKQAAAMGYMAAAAVHKRDMEAHQLAITALREKAEREDSKPLTIEELKQMIGEPVWVQGPGIPEYGRWAIVEDAFGNSLFLVNDFTCHDIGKTWEAYRHKPKEVTE